MMTGRRILYGLILLIRIGKIVCDETCLANTSRISFVYPKSGDLIILSSNGSLEIRFEVINFEIPKDGVVEFKGPKFELLLTKPVTLLHLNNVEPGSYFVTAQLFDPMMQPLLDRVAQVYFEIIRNPTGIQFHRYVPTEKDMEYNIPPRERISKIDKMKICYVSSLQFDGQKRIWLQQMEQFPKDQFDFCFITFSSLEKGHILSFLETNNIPIHNIELIVSAEEAIENNVDATNTIQMLLTFEPKVTTTTITNQLQFEWQNNAVPVWCRRIWMNTVMTLQETQAQVVVFGNSVSDADQLLSKALAFAGIPNTVIEMTNLHPVKMMVSRVISPSHFVHHQVVAEAQVQAEAFHVICPGVNVSLFTPKHSYRTPGGRIGYIGRLSSEKSLGLVIQAAVFVHKVRPQARFIIVGDGPMRQQLEEYVRTLNLQQCIQFTGAIYDDRVLAQVYQSIDVLASTTLRTETFQLSNIEAMAAGVPVVTFGIGGIGQYIKHAVNGIVVDKADPKLLADQLLTVLSDRPLQQRLSKAAMETVRTRYTIEQSMNKYQDLYTSLVWKEVSREKLVMDKIPKLNF